MPNLVYLIFDFSRIKRSDEIETLIHIQKVIINKIKVKGLNCKLATSQSNPTAEPFSPHGWMWPRVHNLA